MPLYVNIALPIAARRHFTYTVTESMRVQPGMRALVPFGKRTVTGIIVETGAAALADARPVQEILDDEPIITPSVLQLTRWISDYYLSSWGEALNAAIQQGMTPQSVLSVRLIRTLDEQDLLYVAQHAPKRAALLRVLLRHTGTLSVAYLQQQLKTDSVTSQLEALEHAGVIEIQRSLKDQPQPKVQKALTLSTDLIDNPGRQHELLDELDSRAPKQSQLLSTLLLHHARNGTPMLTAEALKTSRASAASAKSLIEKNIISECDIEVHRGNEHLDESEKLNTVDETTYALNDEQSHAVQAINTAIDKAKAKTFLLHGVTGSGKTLVYMHAIKHAHSKGKTALVLVPEISLTPQLVDRFRAVFGQSIAIFHSRMSIGERYDEWRSIFQGKVNIVLGVRSALFVPIANLGLIIVDEEHESSYKQDSPSPRYNARDCAVMRGNIDSAVVVLGSATPSVESMYNAQTAKYHLLEIRDRVDHAVLPEVRVVDLIDQRKRKLMRGSFSTELIEEIKKRCAKKEGVMLLHNRRGFAPRLECVDCGYVPKCKDCTVSLTYHKLLNQLRCHYCGYSIALLNSCPECGSTELHDVGAGTQRIEEELALLLESDGVQARIQRVDLDSTSKKGSFRKMLVDFQNGAIDILVGTKMIAKGLDFERVTLVGVVNADLQLYLPDFRSSERSFQLLTQVAGRAGRSAERRGEVLLQSAHPQHPAVIATKLAQYDVFYNDELQQRREADYPPFSRFVVIELNGRDMQQVQDHAQHFAFALPRRSTAVVVLGPSKPDIDRIRGQYRRVIILKGIKSEDPSGNILRQVLQNALTHYRDRHATSAVKVSIDVDSYSAV